MATSRKPRPMKECFDGAVSVIRSLPNEGPYQPSNATKLRFYALYKQVTLGPCNIAKPGFWDAVGRAKWEAWSVCGEMSKEVAMQMYVEELTRLVETMPQTPEVEQFLNSISPFYTETEQDDSNDEQPDPTTVTMDTPPPKPQSEKETDDDEVSPSEEVLPPKPSNQIADEEESDGDESSAESDSSIDFKDSFQELNANGSRQPTTSSPGQASQTSPSSSTSMRREQGQPRPPQVAGGNRTTRTVTFAEPPARDTVQSLPGLSTGGERVQLSSSEGYPLALETVTTEIARLQSSIQSMLQQLNTLALAINSLTRARGQRGAVSGGGVGSQLMVPTLVTRRGPFLTLLIKSAPVLVAWPIVVTVVMTIITKRYSLFGNHGVPSWLWTLLSILQAVFTLLVASRLQR